MKKLVNTSELSFEDWLKERKKGIGGSDAAAIAGLNPWKSALSVWLDKTDDAREGIPDNERMRVGRDLEDYVAKRFEEASGKKVRRNNFLLGHAEHDFLIANIDREVVGEKSLLECKTTNSYAKNDWEDGKIPLHYEIQCLHYLMVTGYERCYIAVLIGNEKFVYKTIERDEDTINNLLKLEKDFWENHVVAMMPPDPDGSDDYSTILKKKYKGDLPESIELQEEEKIDRYFDVTTLIKELETEKKVIEQGIQTQMGDYQAATAPGAKITWKPYTTNRFDSKRFKVDHEDLYEDYINTTEARRFAIKRVEG